MYKTISATIGLLLTLGVSAGVFAGGPTAADDAQDAFFESLSETCGKSYLGKVVESNESDASWREARIIIHTPACDTDMDTEIRIPLHVGENTSRTWIVSKTEKGLRLKHDHRHSDGTPDAVSMYGGDSAAGGSPSEQNFPVDDFSKALFVKNGLDVSVTNTWTLSIKPGERLSYRLSRPGRLFQINFDLSKAID